MTSGATQTTPTNGQLRDQRDWDLPTIKALEHLPTIGIDTRENERLVFTRCPYQIESRTTGDYGILNLPKVAALEKKSLGDLIICCSSDRDRFKRQVERMAGHDFRRLIILCDRSDIEQHKYRSNMEPRSVLATLASIEVTYDCPVCFFATPEAAALKVESWLAWVAYRVNKNARVLNTSV